MPESASERFARAVEGGPIGPEPDEELRADLALVAALREIGESARLDDVARQRMRRELLAEFGDPGDTGDSGGASDAGRASDSSDTGDIGEPPVPARRRHTGVRGRLLVAAAAALCLLLSLSAMSLLMARDALPGEALYGVKRSAESAELGFTFGTESRGFKHLQFATARLDELETLAAQDGSDADPYLTALEAFDTDAAAGSRLLIEAATDGSGSQLAALRDWAGQQAQRLETTTPGMPEQAAARAAESREQLNKIADRATALRERLGCTTVTSGATDEVGLLPADGPCEPAARPGGGPNQPGPSGRPTGDPSQPGTPSTGQPRDPANPSAPATATGERSGGSPLLALPPLLLAPNPEDPEHATGGADQVEIPLPLLAPLGVPPVHVPPLLPGLGGVRIG